MPDSHPRPAGPSLGRQRRHSMLLLPFLLLLPAGPAAAQPDFSAVEIQTEKLADGVHMLVGAGGNIGVSSGEDGVFLVDDQFAPLTEKIRKAVAEISDGPIRFVLNTHWHFDHTGGNENFGKAGSLIVAHDNVRVRMSTDQLIESLNRNVPAAPDAALPVVTYAEGVTFHLNGQTIHAFHVPPAHTDGDSIVHFREADVVHMGDLFFNGVYPFIDLSSGGSVEGMIAAVEKVLAMAGDGTKIVPGHGPLATKADLAGYRDMLTAVRDAILPLVEADKTREEVS
ncbi:MAG: MBL fold metallo-hydrolase [Holophagales bacterium]|nr:MBL fold metallo-hydrolase [Holophagales bacterium]